MENVDYHMVSVKFPGNRRNRISPIERAAINEYCCQGVEEFGLDEQRVDEILGDRAFSGGNLPEEVLDEVDRLADGRATAEYKFYFYGDSGSNAHDFRE